MNDRYCIHCSMDCKDKKTHRLSYDLTSQTENSVHELGRVVREIETRFPGVRFWITKNDDVKVTEKENGTFEITRPEEYEYVYKSKHEEIY